MIEEETEEFEDGRKIRQLTITSLNESVTVLSMYEEDSLKFMFNEAMTVIRELQDKDKSNSQNGVE